MEVKGFPNYLIYPDGRVWSKPRIRVKGGFLKPFNTGRGYLCVQLRSKEKNQTKPVHRLVAEHYIYRPENTTEVDHKNRIKEDNCVENLRWVTSKENQNNKGDYKLKRVRKTDTGFGWITRNGNNFMFRRNNCGNKTNKSLSKLLCYSFFYLLKHPLVPVQDFP